MDYFIQKNFEEYTILETATGKIAKVKHSHFRTILAQIGGFVSVDQLEKMFSSKFSIQIADRAEAIDMGWIKN